MRAFDKAVVPIREVYLPVAGAFLASRLCLLLIAVLASANVPTVTHAELPSWTTYLCRFDCGWYLGIAEHGYSSVEVSGSLGATNFAFYPFFPLLVRALAPAFSGNFPLAAIVLANLCFFAALVYVYRYARLLNYDRRTGLLGVVLICFLPQSIAFSAAYTESIFLLLFVAAAFHLRRGQYVAAGLATAALSATRANGVFFLFFALVWVLRHGGAGLLIKPWQAPEKFIPLVFAPLGAMLFWGFCLLSTGDAFAHPTTELYGWGWSFSAPWINLPVMLRTDATTCIAVFYSFAVFACSLWLLREHWYEDFAVCAAFIVLIWSGEGLTSNFRYWLVLFPIWIVLARRLAPHPILCAMVFSILAALNGLMMCAWTLSATIAI